GQRRLASFRDRRPGAGRAADVTAHVGQLVLDRVQRMLLPACQRIPRAALSDPPNVRLPAAGSRSVAEPERKQKLSRWRTGRVRPTGGSHRGMPDWPGCLLARRLVAAFAVARAARYHPVV